MNPQSHFTFFQISGSASFVSPKLQYWLSWKNGTNSLPVIQTFESYMMPTKTKKSTVLLDVYRNKK